MRLLLDTHIWLWMILNPEKLSRTVRRDLGNPKNQLFLSTVSIWEDHHVARHKRFRVIGDNVSKWINDSLAKARLQEAPFNFAVASQAAQITLPQSDIGDIFIAATACTQDLTLVTSDSQLLECSWLRTLANQ